MGWKVLIIWECELKRNVREDRLERLIKKIKEEQPCGIRIEKIETQSQERTIMEAVKNLY